MSELLPTVQAEDVRGSLLDYLTTTFALADEDARAALTDFLTDPESGLFKGPYVRLRLPFRPADEGWRESLDWYSGFPPYGHQAAAFHRLSSANLGPAKPWPLPTLVTTGTGSGKTEAFLIPILDHVLRAKRAGETGTKAVVLYPMNALANDQAKRLTQLLTTDPGLAGVTAALYTGQKGGTRTKVTVDGLITDRAVIRSDPPDILLTNYKMLDQLLLRADDASLWAKSAHSLRYLVLDEFHTYDGAQGTDVSMLLRRLGLALKSHWKDGDERLTAEDRQRPLGRITPVATSATLGDKGDPEAMLHFATTVFGEEFAADGVVTESRLTVKEWIGKAPTTVQERGYEAIPVDDDLAAQVVTAVDAVDGHADGRLLTETVVSHLYGTTGAPPALRDATPTELLDLLRVHPVTERLLAAASHAVSLRDLAAALVPVSLGARDGAARQERAEEFGIALLAAFSHLRAAVGRDAPSVDLHLWVRELTRIDRSVSHVPRYLWSDDGDLVTADGDDPTDAGNAPALPALYCRHCGRSGWGAVLAPTGSDLDTDDANIRRRRMARDERFRPLVYAPTEGDRAVADPGARVQNLMWFAVRERRLLATAPDETALRGGGVLPVLTHLGADAGEQSLDDTCPSCQQTDGIRFLGSAIATLLSVTLSTLFGAHDLDAQEKKALVFTDSVQDAAHRAGFVQTRSFSLTLRAVLREAVGEHDLSLDDLADEVLTLAGDDPHRRYRVVPPQLVDHEQFTPFWQAPRQRDVPATVRARVKRRLQLDAALEFGLQSRTGRTLERTGSVAAEVAVAAPQLLRAAEQALEEAGELPTLEGLDEPGAREKAAWVRGVLERMRQRGAIAHPWFERYQREDGNRYSIWGGRPRSDGMPAFPRGRAAPGYPRIGGARLEKSTDLDAVATPQSWYALWTARTLGVSPQDGARLARLLFQRLAHLDVLGVTTSSSNAQIYQLRPASVVLTPIRLEALRAGEHTLVCEVCQALEPVSRTVAGQLDGAPCMVARCAGRLVRGERDDNFYRRMYASTGIQRVIAREHTSMLEDEVRLRYEEAFKQQDRDPQAPNVLVATPTLEMGIDIGDLSTVMLAGLPKTVASYLQRIGRAGRLTGNSLNLAFVTGRGDQLPRLGDPLSVVNGKVRPPATYLDAEEILRRQFVAFLADRIARTSSAPHPRSALEAIGSTDPGSYLQALIADAEENTEERLESFLAGFPTLTDAARERLRAWVTPLPDLPGASGLATRLHAESQRWQHTVQTLTFRQQEIEKSLPALQQIAASPAATDADKRAERTAKAALRLTRGELAELRGEYWIGVLEGHGLLPNYTLLDDSVTLDVTLSWTDPDTGEYQNDPVSYHRDGSQALREFAPGATFYAGGYRIVVDALDLGHDGEAVHTLVLCPACGYATDAAPPPACPRCGSTAIADTKQRFDVVELQRVSSAMRRDDAVITDDRDDRIREPFTIVTAVDVDPDRVTRRWYVEGYGFGAKHLRDQTIRWINIGKGGVRATPRTLAGEDLPAPLFRVCSSCGQLDTDTRRNRPEEHRPWCPRRSASTEDTRSVALTRTLNTEGLVVRLPTSVTLGDHFAVPSLSAAIMLGLREHLGGAPDHIAVTTIVDPTPTNGGDNSAALLLHDVVPGGTGYLAELADPETVWTILRAAWAVLKDCPCQREQRLACHRCLLPFASPHQVRSVSRAAGERHLRDILLASGPVDAEEPPVDMAWKYTQDEPDGDDPESTLEKRFRVAFTKRLQAMGATVKDQPTSSGNRSIITLGGNGRVWTLEPQQITLGSKPDFMLRCSQAGIPEVAIFTDGWRYHASPVINRLADDATKRAALRASGRIVLGITWQDVQAAQSGTVTPPSWWDAVAAGHLMAGSEGQLSQALLDLVTGGPFDLLMWWIQNPDPDALARLAHWLPWFLLGSASATGVALPAGTLTAAADALDGDVPVQDGGATWLWTQGSVAVAADLVHPETGATNVALVLDDRPEQLGLHHADAWRTWLQLSNLLALRQLPTVITTRTHIDTASPSAVVQPTAPAVTAALPPEWQELHDLGTAVEQQLIVALAAAGVSVPVQGEESPEGIPLGLAWPDQRVVVDFSMDDADKVELDAAGWHVVEPDVEAVQTALTAGKA
ncbi:DEAD/DEAH box helicase [Kineococcus terrestris]|uniref:DEAD/DEAH box helicase n=1 Tax=Kineococcus terrestris TaxID=2044856 RepID=UPI0034DB63B8